MRCLVSGCLRDLHGAALGDASSFVEGRTNEAAPGSDDDTSYLDTTLGDGEETTAELS